MNKEIIDSIQIAPVSHKSLTLDEAKLYCMFCTHNGYTDWRLPTCEEYAAVTKLVGWCDIDTTTLHVSLFNRLKRVVFPVRSI